MPTVDVQLESAPYTVHIEHGGLEQLGQLARETVPHQRVVLAVDANIVDPHGARARASLEDAGFEVVQIELVAEEAQKTLATVRRMYEAMLEARIERLTPVVAMGGGVVGDTAGFAAATFLRGLPFIQVPTTLLAMVDASIGGKTGVNIDLPDQATLGKNLIGAFWQPRFVLADPQVLSTLESRDFACGLAECIKHGMICSADHLTFLADRIGEITAQEPDDLASLIEASVSIKAGIVAGDEREAGDRALLNLGHTFAHAIEPIPELDLRHGEAVAIGLAAACHAGVITNRLESSEADSIIDLLGLYELPTRLSAPIDIDRLIELMRYDKKVAGGRLPLVLPTGIGDVELIRDSEVNVVRAAWREVGGR